MKEKPFVFLPILLCLLFANSKAQTLAFRKYSVSDGLIHSRVYRILQDVHGLLWLTTDNGLSCFDGYEFRNYSSDEYDFGAAISICQMPDSSIWFSTSLDGIKRIKNGIVERISLKNKIPPSRIVQISAGKQGEVWLLDESNHAGYIRNSIYQDLYQKELFNKVFKILPQSDQSVLLATDEGVFIVWPDKRIRPFMKGGAIFSLTVDKSGKIYAGGEGKISVIHPSGRIEQVIYMPENIPVTLLYSDRSGNIWGTGSKPSLYLITNGAIKNYLSYLNLQNTYVNDIFIDNCGNIFLATHGMGLYSFNNIALLKYEVKDGLAGNNISTIKEDGEGNIYAGSYGGVSVFKNGSFRFWNTISVKSNEIINDIHFGKNTTWLTSPYTVYKLQGGRISRRDTGGLCLFQKGNDIYVGDYGGLRRYALLSFRLNTPFVLNEAFTKKRIKRIIGKNNGIVWVATKSGLFSIDSLNNLKEYFTGYIINDLYLDRKGILWAATGKGLWKLEKGKWLNHSPPDKPKLCCTALTESKDGRLWVGSQKGLWTVEKTLPRFYFASSELAVEDISCLHADKKGNLWIGTETGIYMLDLTQERLSNPIPSVIISSLRIEDSNIQFPHKKLEFPYHNNHLQVSYFSPDYSRSKDIIYEYSINRNSKQINTWYATSNRSLEFSSLSPGEYILEVRARYRNSKISSKAVQLHFRILKPLWQQWWFILTGTIATLTVFYYLFRMRIRSIREKEKLKAQRYSRLLQLKQQAVNSLISPHFIFNSLNSIQYFINNADKLSANRYLSRFASLIRKTIEDSSKYMVRLSDEIERLELYLSLEKIRLDSKLTYSIEVDERLNTLQIKIPSMLVQPYVENAVWHGIMPKPEGGNVSIGFSYLDSGRIKVSIIDDGIGITNSWKMKNNSVHTSRGMDISNKRVNLLGKITRTQLQTSITQIDEDGDSGGTRVELELPIEWKQIALKA